MHYVYILHSPIINKYYVGETHDIPTRISRHNEGYYDNKWTKAGKPWGLFYSIPCKSRKQALKIERHIKSMKSKVYISNLKKYPEIAEKLRNKYDC